MHGRPPIHWFKLDGKLVPDKLYTCVMLYQLADFDTAGQKSIRSRLFNPLAGERVDAQVARGNGTVPAIYGRRLQEKIDQAKERFGKT